MTARRGSKPFDRRPHRVVGRTYWGGQPGGIRLPSLGELQTIVQHQIYDPGPVIDSVAVPDTPPTSC